MYSPRRTTAENYETLLRSPERRNLVASPLRAIASPFYNAVKTAQNNASRDFDKFYDTLQQTLTPRTSQARMRQQTLADTTDNVRSMLQQRADDTSTRTSLTPLIQRHTLREDARANYSEYTSRNPFYQESVSEIADTPSLSDQNDDTPMTRTSLGKRSCSYTRHSPSNRKRPYNGLSTTLQQKLEHERKRMDQLQRNLQKIKRQSSLLAEDLSATHLNFEHDDEEEEEDDDQDMNFFMSAAPSSKQDILNSLSVKCTADESRSPFNTFSINAPVDSNATRLYKPQTNNNKPTCPSSTPSAFLPSPKRTSNTKNNSNSNPLSTCAASPHRINSPKRILTEISSANLRSAETISTPGGSRVSNRFWKEIHGLNARKESCSNGRVTKPQTPDVGRISTAVNNNNNASWANDDGFWSADNSPVASSLNNKLFQLARQDDKTEQEKRPIHIRRSITRRLFDTAANESEEEDGLGQQADYRNVPPPTAPHTGTHSLSAEIESANKRDEIKKRNNIPTMNAHVLAELKAKHKEKLIDDTDSYKFA